MVLQNVRQVIYDSAERLQGASTAGIVINNDPTGLFIKVSALNDEKLDSYVPSTEMYMKAAQK
jgi:hypothetical protein